MADIDTVRNSRGQLAIAQDMLQTILKCIEIYYRLGFTIPCVDKILVPYAQKSWDMYFDEYMGIKPSKEEAKEYAYKKVYKEMEQGFQGWEYKFNTVASSRGDYPKDIGALYSNI